MMTRNRFIQSKHGRVLLQNQATGGLIAARETRPETGHRETRVHSFIAELQGLLVKHMTLEPYFSRQRCAHFKLAAAERSRINQNLQPEFFQIEMDPVKLAAREGIMRERSAAASLKWAQRCRLK